MINNQTEKIQQWEYDEVVILFKRYNLFSVRIDANELNDVLQAAGELGWQLCCMVERRKELRVFFKRQKQQP